MREENEEDNGDDVFTNMAREQIDAATLRELVKFLRTTEPPTRAPSFDVGNDCLGSTAAFRGDKRRWSIQSLRKGRRSRRPSSLQIQLPETAVPKTTAAGHSYIAISVPRNDADRQLGQDGRRLSSQLRLSIPRHIRLSNLTMSGFAMPDDLSWVKEVETKRDGPRSPSMKSPPTSPTSPTITVLTPPEMRFAALSSHPPIQERPGTRSTLADRDSPVMMLPTSPDIILPSSPMTPVETPRPSSASSAPPKLLAHRRQLSAFPNTSSRSSSPMSASPRSRQPKKPSSIVVRPRLEVPQTNQLPESPGFPTMLAAMTFPSPPETSPVHSPSNSISSIPPMRSSSPSSTSARRSPPRAMLESSLDQRMMQQPARPPLRKVRSDAGPQITNVPHRSVASSLGIYHHDEAAELSAQKAQLCGEPSSNEETDEDKTSKPTEESTSTKDAAQARSSASTTDSYQFETASESYRHSLRSDTTETSISTQTSLRGRGREPSNRPESVSSTMDILNRKRSGRPRASRPESTKSRDQSVEDDRRGRDSERSSIMSASSSGTVKTSTTQSSMAADRRMARKAKIREKFQKDLNATKAKPPRPTATVFMDSVDSPVLGRFPQNATGPIPPRSARRTSVPGPSPLAAGSSDSEEPSSRHVSRRSSVHDIAQLIPRTVPEDAASASPTTPRAPGQEPLSPTLTMSPVMVVASIEANANAPPVTPPGMASLRPLSLLNPGISPPIPPPRLSIRAEGKPNPRQRPLPIKIAGTTKTNRKSVPNMPTPPLSADSPSAFRRMSLPIQKNIPAPTHPWQRPALHAESNKKTAVVSRERETEWLRAHQRETAKEWRMAALKERTRLERLAMERDAAALAGKAIDDIPDERDEVEEGEEKDEVTRQLRERNSSRSIASSTTKQNNRMDTLDVLNNAAEKDDSEKSGTTDKAIEERLSRLEKNGDAWLAVVMPLLQDMNQMLRDLRRESVGQDVTMKIMDSAIAAGLMPADSQGSPEGATGVSKHES